MSRPPILQEIHPAERMPETAPKAEPLKIKTYKVPPESAPCDVCKSPSWSDHGEKEKRKEKKRQDKKQREAEKQRESESEARTGRKLTKKPPPAAMETQKMPEELRRPRRNSLMSIVFRRSISQDRQGRPSKEERRMSGGSFASILTMHRSQSETRGPPVATREEREANAAMLKKDESWKPVVNPIAPKLPSFRWHPKKRSRSNSKSNTPDESNGVEDFLAFAYQVDEPAIKKTFQDEVAEDVQQSNDAMKREILGEPKTIRIIKSQTDPLPSGTLEQDRDRAADEQPKQGAPVELHDTSRKPQKEVYKSQKPRTSDEAIADLEAMLESPKYGGNHSPPSPQSPQQVSRPSNDGSSYVHKQRMYQQQRSIAGFQEQEALQFYNNQVLIAMGLREGDPQVKQQVGIVPAPFARERRPSSPENRSREKVSEGLQNIYDLVHESRNMRLKHMILSHTAHLFYNSN